jgi:hypothetical protein
MFIQAEAKPHRHRSVEAEKKEPCQDGDDIEDGDTSATFDGEGLEVERRQGMFGLERAEEVKALRGTNDPIAARFRRSKGRS